MDLKDPVSTNMHCVRRWLSMAINLVLIIAQASGKHCKPRFRENNHKNRGTQCIVANTGSLILLAKWPIAVRTYPGFHFI